MVEEVRLERDLYGPTRLYANTAFIEKLRGDIVTRRVQIFVADTSQTGGSDSGYWSKPDVSAFVLGRGQYVPHWVADLHTFEVKTASGLNESSVHEANSHGRFGKFAWLVFQSVGRANPDGETFKKVHKLCAQMGVGMVHFTDPAASKVWQISQAPRPTGAESAAADKFIRDRFPQETKDRISERLAALGWSGDA